MLIVLSILHEISDQFGLTQLRSHGVQDVPAFIVITCNQPCVQLTDQIIGRTLINPDQVFGGTSKGQGTHTCLG